VTEYFSVYCTLLQFTIRIFLWVDLLSRVFGVSDSNLATVTFVNKWMIIQLCCLSSDDSYHSCRKFVLAMNKMSKLKFFENFSTYVIIRGLTKYVAYCK
jgi:hypothetical protein